jgi:hypothetical protein
MYRVKIVTTAGVRVTTYVAGKAAAEAFRLLAGQKRGDVYLLDAATSQILRQSFHGPAGAAARERARPRRCARAKEKVSRG